MKIFKTKVVAYLEDDPHQRALISKWLTMHGYLCSAFDSADAIKGAISDFSYDAVLLDWQLDSGSSGLDVLLHVRSHHGSDIPVVFLSSKNEQKAINAVLHAGADEYLIKPVAKNDLLNVLDDYLQVESSHADVIAYGDYQQDTVNKQITLNGEGIDLSTSQYALASHLFSHAGKTVAQATVLDIICESAGNANVRQVVSGMYHLKKQLRLADTEQWQLQTIQGYGYRLAWAKSTRLAA